MSEGGRLRALCVETPRRRSSARRYDAQVVGIHVSRFFLLFSITRSDHVEDDMRPENHHR